MANTTSAAFRYALVFAVIWWIVLLNLVLFTANRVTLNVAQLELADAIVTARLAESKTGKLVIEKVWSGPAKIVELQLDPQLFSGSATDSTWLIPLTRTGNDRFDVTRAVSKNSHGDSVVQPAYVYPWNAEAQQQLDAFLAGR
ncbi:MAG: hypothetical protein O2955_17660 [Planctomycetota bacterium]|nr:hypothetical protein [Planctomycetota bacterium]